MAVSAHDVAAMLISEQVASGQTIDKMQLQKLLYVVQGANLEFWGEPAFREKLLAYRNGPVVRDVEATYREATAGRVPLQRPFGGDPNRLDDQVVETVRAVLRYFGAWDALSLERYVKSDDSPWLAARAGLSSDAASDAEIPVDGIREWFHRRGVDPTAAIVEHWDASPQERYDADERLRAAKASGAFAPEVTDEERDTAERALARIRGGA